MLKKRPYIILVILIIIFGTYYYFINETNVKTIGPIAGGVIYSIIWLEAHPKTENEKKVYKWMRWMDYIMLVFLLISLFVLIGANLILN